VSLRIPKLGAIGLVVAFVAAIALFLFFMSRFGGPSVRLSSPYEVSAMIPDTEGLAARSDVLDRGVKVGEVESVDVEGDQALVKLAVDGDHAPLRADTTVRVAQKTLFGESYIDMSLGHGASAIPDGTRLASSQVLPAAVDIDEALSALDAPARRDLQGVVQTFGRGAAIPDASGKVSATIGGLARTTSELRRLTQTLQGQEGEIASAVQDGGTVVDTLARREASLRQIVSGGRATLAALASRSDSLRTGLAELPGLLDSARTTLTDARPLIGEARPLATDLATAAKPLREALLDMPPAARSANGVLAGLTTLNRTALPFLDHTDRVLGLAAPAAAPLSAAFRNLQPIVKYLADRRTSVAAWFTNTGDLGASSDSKGHFARFFVGIEPGTTFGFPGAFKNNAYTGPNDALANRPYSGFPRLMPYNPASP
jgi:phospholipid/cholesterol/gamma-HCH transport system substrate-binding protein